MKISFIRVLGGTMLALDITIVVMLWCWREIIFKAPATDLQKVSFLSAIALLLTMGFISGLDALTREER